MIFLIAYIALFSFSKAEPYPTFFSEGKTQFAKIKYIGGPYRVPYDSDLDELCGCDGEEEADDYTTDYEFHAHGWKLRIIRRMSDFGRRRLLWINKRGIEYLDKRSAAEITRLFKKYFKPEKRLMDYDDPYCRWKATTLDAGYNIQVGEIAVAEKRYYSLFLNKLGYDLGYYSHQKTIELLCSDSLSGCRGENILRICFTGPRLNKKCYSREGRVLREYASKWLMMSDISHFLKFFKESDSSTLSFNGRRISNIKRCPISMGNDSCFKGAGLIKLNKSNFQDSIIRIFRDSINENSMRYEIPDCCGPTIVLAAFSGRISMKMLISNENGFVMETNDGEETTYNVCFVKKDISSMLLKLIQKYSATFVLYPGKDLNECPILSPSRRPTIKEGQLKIEFQ